MTLSSSTRPEHSSCSMPPMKPRFDLPSSRCYGSVAGSVASPWQSLVPLLSKQSAIVHPNNAPSAASFSTAAAATRADDESLSYSITRRPGLRNTAVIAHVDHGKTTLVDQLLHAAQCSMEGTWTSSSADLSRLLDSGELEKERGITITSKVTRLEYASSSGETTVVNCVDTPGHADFSAEVDRILDMVDGVVLVVDAGEGPKSQTKYVLTRALALGLKPVVVLNKCDREDAIARIDSGETEGQLADLFAALGANEDQMAYRTLYASAREGWVTEDPLVALELAEGGEPDATTSMNLLLETLLEEIPAPAIRTYSSVETDPFSLGAVTVGYDPYLGRTCTGRIVSGTIQLNDDVTLLRRDAAEGDESTGPRTTVSGLFVYRGIHRVPLEEGTVASAGDIVTLCGVPDSIAVGDTITSSRNPVAEPLPTPALAPPTLAMDFGASSSPLAGKEGTKVASSQIRDRLYAETDNNVTLKVESSSTDAEKTTVYARGELQLGILIETMRREGFEMTISPPRILTKTCLDTGVELEPYEEVVVDVDSEHASTVVSSLTGDRKGIMLESTVTSDGKTKLVFESPSRGLLGFQSEIATATKGSAVVNHLYLEHRPHAGNLGTGLEKGKLVSNASGKATTFALASLSARGTLFIGPGDLVYPGMVVGESAKGAAADMEVNPIKEKEKTNMRTQSKDEKVYLAPPKKRSVEELIGYMQGGTSLCPL